MVNEFVFIFDVSANTHKNEPILVEEIICSLKHELTKCQKKYKTIPKIVIKSQNFLKAGENVPIKPHIWEFIYKLARCNEFECAASVFDIPSLRMVERKSTPFIKIANQPELRQLINWSDHTTFHVSFSHIDCSNFCSQQRKRGKKVIPFFCVSQYPAKYEHYLDESKNIMLCRTGTHPSFSVSDHTEDERLLDAVVKKRKKSLNIDWPVLWERHLIYEGASGLDAGPWAITPNDLELYIEVINQ